MLYPVQFAENCKFLRKLLKCMEVTLWENSDFII